MGIDPYTKIRLWNEGSIKLKRYGTKYGGWVIPEKFLNSNSIVYCIGCGLDISFDLAIIKAFECNVFAYDPTPDVQKFVIDSTICEERYKFFPLGISGKDGFARFYLPTKPGHISLSVTNINNSRHFIELETQKITSALRSNRHKWIDLIKMDIEGSEYDVLDDLLKYEVPIGVLCVEFDEARKRQSVGTRDKIIHYINRLEATGLRLCSTSSLANYTFVNENRFPFR